MKKVKRSRLELILSYVVTILIGLAFSYWCSGLLLSCYTEEILKHYPASELGGFKIMYFVFIFLIMFCALTLPVAWAFRKKYSRDFRGYYFKIAMDKYFDTVEWKPKKGFNKEFIGSLGIINPGYRFKSDNYFKCSDQDLYFEMADIRVTTYWVQESVNAAKEKSLTNPATAANRHGYAFHGQWMAFDTNKSVNSNLIIVPNFMGDTNLSSTFGGNRIETELPEFNMKFKIYSDDPEEAYEILTTEVLYQLLTFAKKTNCQYYFGFEGSKLYIGVHSFGQGKYLNIGSSFRKIHNEKIKTEAEENIRDVKALLEFLNDCNSIHPA